MKKHFRLKAPTGRVVAALGDQVGYWAVPFASLMGTIFALIYLLGQALLDPFDGTPNDMLSTASPQAATHESGNEDGGDRQGGFL